MTQDIADQPPAAPTAAERLTTLLLAVFPRLLGALLVYTGWVKFRHPDNILDVLTFDGFSLSAAKLAANLVIVVEALMGLLLIVLARSRLVIGAALLLLLIYSAQLVYLVSADDAPACGCAEPLEYVERREENRRHNLFSLARNGCLIVPTSWALVQLWRRPTLVATPAVQ